MNTDSPSNTILNEKRRLAVKLRLEGRKLAEICDLVDLSSPTIIAAHKQFLSGGWKAVDVKPRGRPTGDKAVSVEAIEQLQLAAFGNNDCRPWTLANLSAAATALGGTASARTIGKYIEDWGLSAPNLHKLCKTHGTQTDWLNSKYSDITTAARKNNATIYWAGQGSTTGSGGKPIQKFIYAHTTRGQYHWLAGDFNNDAERFIEFFTHLNDQAKAARVIIWQGQDPTANPLLSEWLERSPQTSFFQHPDFANGNTEQNAVPDITESFLTNDSTTHDNQSRPTNTQRTTTAMPLTHLQKLEAESIHIMREVIAQADKPVMLYSLGKDSAVMLHLAQKAFYPAKLPFPLLHVDTRWKFQAMYDYRDKIVKDMGLELISHTNPEGLEREVNPFTHGSSLHTDIMKTQGLRQALDQHGFDVAFGGARRDEEISRAKERVFSFRTEQHRWDPKNQRPELWNLYNANKKKGESIRVFPLSNWTELDIWQYIYQQDIPLVPLYFAANRPVVLRDGTWIMVDDDRMPMNEGEVPMMKRVRFRTLGCYPLTGAIESNATTITDVIAEMLKSTDSERQGRVIDHDNAASMEKKKQEGYF